MCNMRERYWIPKLCSLVKTFIHNCNQCKQFRVKPLEAPAKPILPEFRSQLTDPFVYTDVDFAGPIMYKLSKTTFGKSYIALFTCATTRAVHLKLCKDLTATEFQRAMTEFVARRGPPRVMVSDDGKTFVATKTWLKTLRNNEDHEFSGNTKNQLEVHSILCSMVGRILQTLDWRYEKKVVKSHRKKYSNI